MKDFPYRPSRRDFLASSALSVGATLSWNHLPVMGKEAIVTPKDVKFSSDNGWGFTVGYNFNEHLNLAWELSKNTPRYETSLRDAEGDPRTVSHTATFYTSNFNGTYHFMKGPITPFVSAGLGWTTIDSNISDGRGYCVPDWYWGWYCYSSSYDTTTFTYNAALGLRADLKNNMFLRASYGRQWMNEEIGKDKPEFDVGKIEIGYRF